MFSLEKQWIISANYIRLYPLITLLCTCKNWTSTSVTKHLMLIIMNTKIFPFKQERGAAERRGYKCFFKKKMVLNVLCWILPYTLNANLIWDIYGGRKRSKQKYFFMLCSDLSFFLFIFLTTLHVFFHENTQLW